MADRPNGVTTSRGWRKRLQARWQVKWMVTIAGAAAMVIIACIFIWNVITAPNPLTQLVPGFAKTAEHRPANSR